MIAHIEWNFTSLGVHILKENYCYVPLKRSHLEGSSHPFEQNFLSIIAHFPR